MVGKPEELSEMQMDRIKDAITQTDAIFRLEGFEPNEQTRLIDAAVLAGRVTWAQVIAEMREYVIEHKTMEGFVQSRDWARR